MRPRLNDYPSRFLLEAGIYESPNKIKVSENNAGENGMG
jgi:hypothetical protein